MSTKQNENENENATMNTVSYVEEGLGTRVFVSGNRMGGTGKTRIVDARQAPSPSKEASKLIKRATQ